MSDVRTMPPTPTTRTDDGGLGGGTLGGDWPVRAADTVERVVDTVRSKTTGPAIVISRAVVYGLVGVVLGIIALVLALGALIRGLDVLLPRGVWLPDLILGALTGLIGLILWRKRRPSAAST
jgi:hypothetical protein